MPRKGYKQTEEHRRKSAEARRGIGHPHSTATKAKLAEAARRRDLTAFIEGSRSTRFKPGQSPSEKQREATRIYNITHVGKMKGKHHSLEARRKIAASLIGNTHTVGHKDTEATRLKKRLARLGSNNPAWIDGRTYRSYTREFVERIRYEIKQRDRYTCQDCGKQEDREDESEVSHRLHVHHIDTNRQNNAHENLVTLCQSCHRKRHNAINRASKEAQTIMPLR